MARALQKKPASKAEKRLQKEPAKAVRRNPKVKTIGKGWYNLAVERIIVKFLERCEGK